MSRNEEVGPFCASVLRQTGLRRAEEFAVRKQRFSVEQIVAALKQVELGMSVVDATRQLGVTVPLVSLKTKGASATRCICMERMVGIEPTLVAWEATVLPLNYTRFGRAV